MWGSSMHSSGALHLEDGRSVTGLAPKTLLVSWSLQGDSNECFLEVALG